MSKQTAYVILVTEVDTPSYVLTDGSIDLAHAQFMMVARAEELVDEAVEQAALAQEDPNAKVVDDRQMIIDVADDKMSARVYLEPLEGQAEGRDVATFEIHAVELGN